MIDEVRSVLFVGAGTMGCANSLVAAVAGYSVVLHDARVETLAAVAARHEEMARFLLQNGLCGEDDIVGARRRVALAPEMAEAVAGVDLVSESIFENLAAKREIHGKLDAAAPDNTILTTNSSALLVSDIEDVVARGDRFAALHSHLGSPLYDIVGGPRTSPVTVDVLRRYVLSLGGIPLVLKKENPGYVFNALNGAVLTMALSLVLDGRATKEEVDRAWMSDRGAPMGPFGMLDLFGLDLVLDDWRNPTELPNRLAVRDRAISLLEDHVDAGRLGQKSGTGFYGYPDPAYLAPGFVTDDPPPPDTAQALLSALLCAAVKLVTNGVADPHDVDLAWTAATGLDVGPHRIIDDLGSDRALEMIEQQLKAGTILLEQAEPALTRLRN